MQISPSLPRLLDTYEHYLAKTRAVPAMSSESLAPEKSYSIVFLAPTTTSPQDGKLVSTQRAKGFNLSWTNYGLSSTSTSTITTISGTRTTTQTYLTIGQQVTISADAMFSTTPAGEAETWADTGPVSFLDPSGLLCLRSKIFPV